RSRSDGLSAPASVQWPGLAGKPQALHMAGLLSSSDHFGALAAFERVALAEIVCDLLERSPFDPLMPIDIFDEPLEHQEHLRAARHVGVDGEGEHAVIHLAVDPVELVAPEFLDVARIHE